LFLFAFAINTLLHITERRVHHGVDVSGGQS
jgi:hypothetical protein